MQTLDRETFLALIQTKSTTLAQRQHVGEQALAFGLSKPAHVNEYCYLDGAAALLASMMNRWAGLQLKEAADIVRRSWDDWLTLLIRAESFPHIPQYVCVARTSLDPSEPVHIAMGEAADVGNACPPSETSPYLISMTFLLQCLRGNAAKAGIELPPRLTVDPNDQPAYDRWRAEIDALREAAGMRDARVAKMVKTPA